jgi:hypothetical protein
MKRPFLFWKRGKVWYYKLPEIKHYLSTSQTTRRAAENYVVNILNKERASVPCYYTFCKYAAPFFDWELFPDHGYSPWRDIHDYTCFYLAAVTGLRRGEILALRWRHINFERQVLIVSEAWKGGKEIGPPKWDHNRMVPLSPRTIDKLLQLQTASIRIGPDDFVFCYDNGVHFGETW